MKLDRVKDKSRLQTYNQSHYPAMKIIAKKIISIAKCLKPYALNFCDSGFNTTKILCECGTICLFEYANCSGLNKLA